jgi:tetratricopeptide (TPR) repeat protein
MEIAAEDPSDRKAQRDLAQNHYRLGASYVESGQPAHAREHLKSAIEIQKRLLLADPDNSQYRSDIAGAHHFLGVALGSMAQHAEAMHHLDEAIRIRRSALDADPRDTRTRAMLAGNFAEKSTVQLQSGDPAGALASATTAVSLQEQALAHDPQGIPVRISMAQYEWRLGAAHMALAEKPNGRNYWRSAAHWYARAVSHFDQLRSEGHLRSLSIRGHAERARQALERCKREAGTT